MKRAKSLHGHLSWCHKCKVTTTKRAKFHLGYLSPWRRKYKVNLHLCSLSPVNNSVSAFLLDLSRITQVLSHPPVTPPHRRSLCRVEALQCQPLKPHLNVGPTAFMEQIILSWLPQDNHHNFTWLQAKLQVLLYVFLVSVLRLLSPLLVSPSSIITQLVAKTPLLLPHNLWGYIECKLLLSSLQPYPNLIPCLPQVRTME